MAVKELFGIAVVDAGQKWNERPITVGSTDLWKLVCAADDTAKHISDEHRVIVFRLFTREIVHTAIGQYIRA